MGVALAENHFLLRSMLRSPVTNATLQCAPHAGSELWIEAHHFPIHSDRT